MDFIPQSERIRFILVHPSHPGNIGAAARAIKTMGFSRLFVVNPKEKNYKNDSDCIAFSTHSADVVRNSVCTDTLVEALDGVNYAFSLSGYSREYGPPLIDLTEAAIEAKNHLEEFSLEQIAFVFGCERSGLTNEQMALTQKCVAIPANPECDSLNLAQAVQVTAYQLQVTLRGSLLTKSADRFMQEDNATVQAIEGFYAHLEQALVASGALDPQKPKFMMQRLRRLFGRSGLSSSEVDMLRGICASIICPKSERKGKKKSAQ